MTGSLNAEENGFCCRVHDAGAPETLIYLPGLHGDWTLLGPFRSALSGKCRLLEFTYPRRSDWALDDYVGAVLDELRRRGVQRAWLLGESFSSQIVWGIVRHLLRTGSSSREATPSFQPQGIILVGGFVKHPWPWGVRFARWASGAVPLWFLRGACRTYGRWARKRCASCDGAAEIDLFVERRLFGEDRNAITSRYVLIRDEDFRPVAGVTRWPVYCLTGAIDPIVPWPMVWRWIRHRCPGFRGGRVIWRAGHNVLLDAPAASVEQITSWMTSEGKGAHADS